MNEEIKKLLQQIYAEHDLDKANLDYSIIDKYKEKLNDFSQLSNSCFFIVDLYKFEYVFTSDNFSNILGHVLIDRQNLQQTYSPENLLLDSRIHPDDFRIYKEMQLRVGDFILSQPKEERTHYKHIFELRILNIQKKYVRVSWERQVLETDKTGKLWLMLGIIHVLSDQHTYVGVRSSFINLKTGDHILFESSEKPPFELTTREKEVLFLIQQGLLSKEISSRLGISVNTVNIHRQNILQKMNVDNSLEAVQLARKFNILK